MTYNIPPLGYCATCLVSFGARDPAIVIWRGTGLCEDHIKMVLDVPETTETPMGDRLMLFLADLPNMPGAPHKAVGRFEEGEAAARAYNEGVQDGIEHAVAKIVLWLEEQDAEV